MRTREQIDIRFEACGKDYKITADALQFILSYKAGKNNKGEEIWKGEAYYADIEGLIRAIHRKKCREMDIRTLKEIEGRVREVNEYIEKLGKSIMNQISE